jgi:hypothetical protein
MNSPRQVLFSCSALWVLAAACGHAPAAAPPAPLAAPAVAAPAAPAEPVFVPVATAKAALVGSLVSVAPSRIVADLDVLSKRLGLPMQAGQELLSSLGSLGWVGDAAHSRQVWERLEPSAPVATVWVLPSKSAGKGYCAALTFKDPAGARQTLDDLGKPGAQQTGMFERKVAGADSIWAATKGRTLFVSNSAEALSLGGGLAESAQISPKEGQLVLSALPQALAKASGQSNEQLVARLTGALAETAQSAGNKVAAGAQRMVVGLAEALVKMALEASEVRLVLEVGAKNGVLVRAELVPLPGTELATRIARRAPYLFDERLPVRGDGTVVLAMGDLSPWFVAFAPVLEGSGTAGQAMRRDMTQWFGMVGDVSCVVEPVAVGFTSLCSSSLKQGAEAKGAVDAAVALLTSQNAWEAELEGRKASPLKIKRKKDSVEVEKKIQNSDATAKAMARAMAGGDTIKTVIAVKAGRLVQGTGQKARDFVASYGGTAGNLKNAPLVAAALASTQGMEAMASVDVVAILLRLFGKAKDLPASQMAAMAGALPGVAEMQAPFLFDLRTGSAMTSEFRIPLGSLDNIGKVVQGVLGGAGGPPSP